MPLSGLLSWARGLPERTRDRFGERSGRAFGFIARGDMPVGGAWDMDIEKHDPAKKSELLPVNRAEVPPPPTTSSLGQHSFNSSRSISVHPISALQNITLRLDH